MMSSMIILKSKQYIKLAKKVRSNKMDEVVGLFAMAYAQASHSKRTPILHSKDLCALI